VYAATKAAVKHFSEGMRRELANYPIHVMTVYPTATDTDMMETANMGDMDDPQDVAKASINGLLNKEIEVILGGSKQKEMVKTNINEPLKVDKKLAGSLDAMKERAENHRSM
jgi:short-subunit dehydrogenase